MCEQAHQQLKEELGLDHFEGRSWTGLHRHALMTLIAFAFLQHQRLAAARRGKKSPRAPASAEPAGDPSRHHPPDGKRPLAICRLPLLPTTHHVITPQTQTAKVVLDEWQRFWNWERPHNALGGKTPIDRICELMAKILSGEAIEAAYNPAKERIRLADYAIDPTLARVK